MMKKIVRHLFLRCANSMGRLLGVNNRQPSLEACSSETAQQLQQQQQLEWARDRRIVTADDDEIMLRRSVILQRTPGQSFGFGLQSVVVQQKKPGSDELVEERITYVNRVDDDSPADLAGIVPGDVIIAVDGEVVVDRGHEELVSLLQSKDRMRLIVLFENMLRKVELIALYLDLENQLSEKRRLLAEAEEQERGILQRHSSSENLAQLSTSIDEYESSTSTSTAYGEDDCCMSSGELGGFLERASSGYCSINSAESWSADEGGSVEYC